MSDSASPSTQNSGKDSGEPVEKSMSTPNTSPTPAAAPKRENLLLNIIFNIATPGAILSWLSEPKFWQWLATPLGSLAYTTPTLDDDKTFASACALVLALLFPISYGLYDFATRRKTNFISILGFGSVLITGGMGLMKADGMWFAVKEAGVPLLIGLMVLISQRTKRPLVREFLYNDQMINVPRIEAALAEKGTKADFERLLARSAYLLAFSFLISSILNFTLARIILTSPAGTPEFNAELGRMNWLSWPVIVLPTMGMTLYALWKLLDGAEKLSGLSFDDLLLQPPAKDAAKTDKA